MSRVVGIDLSTKAIDIVALEEASNSAQWERCELVGKDAWARTLTIRGGLTDSLASLTFWSDVYLVALEAPYGHGSDLLNRVLGAVCASLPAPLRAPERCWVVRPDEYRSGLGLKGKPDDVWWLENGPDAIEETTGWRQDARDAYALALWARGVHRQAIEGAA